MIQMTSKTTKISKWLVVLATALVGLFALHGLATAPEASAYLSPADRYYIALLASDGIGPAAGVSYEELALEGRQMAITVETSSDPLATAAWLASKVYANTDLSRDQAAAEVVDSLRAYAPEMIPIIVGQGQARGWVA